MKQRQLLWGVGSFIGMAVLILDSRTALEGAQQGVELCIQSLIPSLFPFFILSGVLTSAFLGTELPLLRPLSRYLGIPAGCESLLIPGFLGGYPAGAQAIGQALRQDGLDRDTARRLLMFCNNAGPSFLFGILGAVFSQAWMLWALWGIHILSALVCGRCFRKVSKDSGRIAPIQISLPEILNNSVRTMGTVCGWVVAFRVLLAFLDRWILWRLPQELGVLISGCLELSNGCLQLGSISDVRLRFVIASVLLAFGGLCVTMQTASVSEGLSTLPYLLSKLMQGLLSLLMSTALMYRIPLLLAAIPLFCLGMKKVVAIAERIVYNGPINSRRNPYAVSKEDRTRLHLLSPGRPAGRGSDPLHQEGSARAG